MCIRLPAGQLISSRSKDSADLATNGILNASWTHSPSVHCQKTIKQKSCFACEFGEIRTRSSTNPGKFFSVYLLVVYETCLWTITRHVSGLLPGCSIARCVFSQNLHYSTHQMKACQVASCLSDRSHKMSAIKNTYQSTDLACAFWLDASTSTCLYTRTRRSCTNCWKHKRTVFSVSMQQLANMYMHKQIE